jgi:hypothetical protein
MVVTAFWISGPQIIDAAADGASDRVAVGMGVDGVGDGPEAASAGTAPRLAGAAPLAVVAVRAWAEPQPAARADRAAATINALGYAVRGSCRADPSWGFVCSFIVSS